MPRAFPYRGRGRIYQGDVVNVESQVEDKISQALLEGRRVFAAQSSANSGQTVGLGETGDPDGPVSLDNKVSFTVPNNSSGGTRVELGPFAGLDVYGYFFLRVGWKRNTTRGTAYLSGYHDGSSVVTLKHDSGTNPGWADLGGSISGDTVTLKLGASNSGGFDIDCQAEITWLPAN